MENENTQNIGDYPLWKPALRALRARPDYGYGLKLPVEYFEQALGRKHTSDAFGLEMLNIANVMFLDEGYYLCRLTEVDPATGLRKKFYRIPAAVDHTEGSVAQTLEHKLSNYAWKTIHVRQKALDNPASNLTEDQRRTAENQLERAAVRSLLMKRQQSISDCVRKHSPKLLT